MPSIRTNGPFGKYVDISDVLPEGASVVVVATNPDGYGLKPRTLLLPHQVYVKDWAEHAIPRSGTLSGRVILIPARSDDYVDITDLLRSTHAKRRDDTPAVG